MWQFLAIFLFGQTGIEDPSALVAFLLLLWDLFDDFVVQTRSPPVAVQQANWAELYDGLIRRGLFKRFYRMSPDAFDKLVELLRPRLTVNAHFARLRSAAGEMVP